MTSSNLIPYLPSSPPPMDDGDEEEDEFGSFTIANHLCNDKINESKGVEDCGKATEGEEEVKKELKLDENDVKFDGNVLKEDYEVKFDGNVLTEDNEVKFDKNVLKENDVLKEKVVESEETLGSLEKGVTNFNSHFPTNDELERAEQLYKLKHNFELKFEKSDNDFDIPCSNVKLPASLNEPMSSKADAQISDSFVCSHHAELPENSDIITDDRTNDSDVVLVESGVEDDFGDFVENGPRTYSVGTCKIAESDDVPSDAISLNPDESCDQWDGFVSSSEVKVDEEEEDEFSDFVCQPSDDALEASVAESEKEGSVVNTRGSGDTFHPVFEAHFDDNVPHLKTDGALSSAIGLSRISELLNSSFPMCSVLEEEFIDDLDNVTNVDAESKVSGCNVWCHVCDIDKTNALSYHWSNSDCNRKFLKAINIDSRNLLFGHNWNSSVPLFAANLSLNPLEPTKTPLKSTEISEDDESLSLPQDTIPPAQFDWNGSGLINPLDASNGASALLDLDFFFTNETGSVNPVPSATWSLENELLGSDSSNSSNLKSTEQISKIVSPLLEQILSSAKLSGSSLPKAKQTTAHSPQAQEVLTKLPDLSFMQAKVLMFPIRSASP